MNQSENPRSELRARGLTSLGYWEARHKREKPKRTYPEPTLSYLDFELCRVFCEYLPKLKGKKILEVGAGGSVWPTFIDFPV